MWGASLRFVCWSFSLVGSFFDSLKVLGLEGVNGLLQDRDPISWEWALEAHCKRLERIPSPTNGAAFWESFTWGNVSIEAMG